jgi:carboxymethylenebutenolidase
MADTPSTDPGETAMPDAETALPDAETALADTKSAEPDTRTATRNAGSAYLVGPDSTRSNLGDRHPGVLVLHSWWGLTPFIRSLCDRIADAGFVALAPDLLNGQTPATEADAELLLRDRDRNASADLVLSSAGTVRSLPLTTDGPIGVLGLSMGASWALWLAARGAEHIGAVSVFYGAQSTDLVGTSAAVQGHFADVDRFVTDDERVEMQAHLHLVGIDPEFHRYPGTGHWFFESDREAYDEAAATLAFDRTVAFLRANLDPGEPSDRGERGDRGSTPT